MTDKMKIANTILDQIGNGALVMLGAKDVLATESGVQFAIRGSRKVSKIVITLDPSDTYTVEFWKGRGLNMKHVASDSFVYADSLRKIIEFRTGLDTSI